jgi:hypothetical protein
MRQTLVNISVVHYVVFSITVQHTVVETAQRWEEVQY